MAVKFNIQNGKLIIDPYTLTVSAFKAIWDYDTSKDKAKACNMLSYVFHMADITKDNVFFDTSLVDKEKLVKRNDFGSENHKFNDKEQKLIDAAIEWYDDLNMDSARRIEITYNKKLDELNDLLNNNVMTVINADDQVKLMDKVQILLTKKVQIESLISKQSEKIKSKGDMKRSPIEKGMIGYKPKDK
jgi:hypothetical protein